MIIDHPIYSRSQHSIPTFHFSKEQRESFQSTAGRSFAPLPPDTIDFRDGPSSRATTTSSAQSKADRARAKTTKVRDARARKITEKKASSDNISSKRKSARIADLTEEANQELSELSSELDEINIRDLERQLNAHRSDQDYQPSTRRAGAGKQEAEEAS